MAVVLALSAILFVPAALGDEVALNSTDQAWARIAVLNKTDLGPKWRGQTVFPDTAGFLCSFHPKTSDLVDTGQAQINLDTPGWSVESEAIVLRTAEMAELKWKRTVVPALLPCIRADFVGKGFSGGNSDHLIAQRLAIPRIGTRSVGYRLTYDDHYTAATLRGVHDVIMVLHGRILMTIRTDGSLGKLAGAAKEAQATTQGEVTLARLLANRIP
jgi:hypothetical protein